MAVMFVIGFVAGAGVMFTMYMVVWDQLKGRHDGK